MDDNLVDAGCISSPLLPISQIYVTAKSHKLTAIIIVTINALVNETFLNMSNITQNEDHVPIIISSKSKEIKICGDNTPELSLSLYPGQKFTIPLKALGQANSTVQGTFYWGRNPQQIGDYHLSPSFRELNDSCTDVSF